MTSMTTTNEQSSREQERGAFEADARPYGFSLRRLQCAAPEPWSEYESQETGHRWGGWLARSAISGSAESGEAVYVVRDRYGRIVDAHDSEPDMAAYHGSCALYVYPLSTPSALPAQALGEVTDAMRKAFDDRNNSLEADERDEIIASILALAAPMPQPEPTSKGEGWPFAGTHKNEVTGFASQQREPQEAAERPANFTELWELYSRVGDAHENHGRNHEKTMEARATFHAALMRALSAPQEASKVEPVAVYLVATGETHESQETYTRHDVRPPFCDAETLYLRPTQQALSDDTKRLDWLQSRSMGGLPRVRLLIMERGSYTHMQGDLREAIDAAILAAAGGSEK